MSANFMLARPIKVSKPNETKNIDNKLACIELKFGLNVDYGLFLENLMYTNIFLHLP